MHDGCTLIANIAWPRRRCKWAVTHAVVAVFVSVTRARGCTDRYREHAAVSARKARLLPFLRGHMTQLLNRSYRLALMPQRLTAARTRRGARTPFVAPSYVELCSTPTIHMIITGFVFKAACHTMLPSHRGSTRETKPLHAKNLDNLERLHYTHPIIYQAYISSLCEYPYDELSL